MSVYLSSTNITPSQPTGIDCCNNIYFTTGKITITVPAVTHSKISPLFDCVCVCICDRALRWLSSRVCVDRVLIRRAKGPS